jgi:hypothetical protein
MACIVRARRSVSMAHGSIYVTRRPTHQVSIVENCLRRFWVGSQCVQDLWPAELFSHRAFGHFGRNLQPTMPM